MKRKWWKRGLPILPLPQAESIVFDHDLDGLHVTAYGNGGLNGIQNPSGRIFLLLGEHLEFEYTKGIKMVIVKITYSKGNQEWVAVDYKTWYIDNHVGVRSIRGRVAGLDRRSRCTEGDVAR